MKSNNYNTILCNGGNSMSENRLKSGSYETILENGQLDQYPPLPEELQGIINAYNGENPSFSIIDTYSMIWFNAETGEWERILCGQ